MYHSQILNIYGDSDFYIYNTEYNTQHKDILDMDQFVLTIYIEYRYKSLINIMIHHN